MWVALPKKVWDVNELKCPRYAAASRTSVRDRKASGYAGSKEGVSGFTDKPELLGRFILDLVIGASGRYSYPELFRRISVEGISLKYLSQQLRKEAEESDITLDQN